jgi:hypothetical protein
MSSGSKSTVDGWRSKTGKGHDDLEVTILDVVGACEKENDVRRIDLRVKSK